MIPMWLSYLALLHVGVCLCWLHPVGGPWREVAWFHRTQGA